MRAWSDARLGMPAPAVALLVAISLPTLACMKKPATAVSPNESAAQTEPGGASSDPLMQLASLEQEMQRLGLPIAMSSGDRIEQVDQVDPRDQAGTVPAAEAGESPGVDGEALGAETEAEEPRPTAVEPEAAADRSPPPKGAKRAEGQRCADVCELSVTICDLEVLICSLSDGHGDDPTYGDACRRAGEDCDTADDECDRCSS